MLALLEGSILKHKGCGPEPGVVTGPHTTINRPAKMRGRSTTRGCIYCDEPVEFYFCKVGVCEAHLDKWMRACGWSRDPRHRNGVRLDKITTGRRAADLGYRECRE